MLNTPSDIEDSAMVGISIRRRPLLAPRAFQRQSRALIPLLLGLDRIDHQLTGHLRDGRTQRLPRFRRTSPRAHLHTDPGQPGQEQPCQDTADSQHRGAGSPHHSTSGSGGSCKYASRKDNPSQPRPATTVATSSHCSTRISCHLPVLSKIKIGGRDGTVDTVWQRILR